MHRRLLLNRHFKIGLFLLFITALFGCSSEPTIPTVSSIVPAMGIPISIPQDLHHQVGPMETLWRISKTYGVSVDSIVQANHLKSSKSISIGQILLIPKALEIRPIIPVYNVRPWTYIVIHHTATEEGDAFTIDQMHHRRGFENGLGYHFLIDNGTEGKEEGQIEVGPRWIKQMDGAHANAAGMNEHGIGISMVGNFSERYVSERQLNSLVFLTSVLRKYYGIPLDHVIRHSDVPGKNTECPGKFFPWNEFKRRLQTA